MIVAAELLASEAWDDWMKEAGQGTGENEPHQQRGVPKCHFWLYKIPTDQIFPANTLWMWSFGASSLLTSVPSTIELELRFEFNLIWRSIIRGLPPLSGNGRKDFGKLLICLSTCHLLNLCFLCHWIIAHYNPSFHFLFLEQGHFFLYQDHMWSYVYNQSHNKQSHNWSNGR